MEKLKNFWLYFLLAVILGCGIFLGLFGRVHAEGINGSEAVFTHIHSNACKRTMEKQCSQQHYLQRQYTEYIGQHCYGCSTWVNAVADISVYVCNEVNASWQQNCKATCPNCGYVISTWSNGGGVHTYSATVDACGISVGEKTTGVCIAAENSWTNQGVWLTVSATKYKNDGGNASLSYSWPDGRFYAEENGIYSVTVQNALGQTAEASITVSCIDKIPPQITSVTGDTAGMTRDHIVVSISASDGESGLAADAFSTDGGATWGSSTSFTVTEGMSLRILVRDCAGNTAERTITRSEFPYPPEPVPTPSPAPAGPDTQAGPSDMTGQMEQTAEQSASASTEREAENTGTESKTEKKKATKEQTEESVTDQAKDKQSAQKGGIASQNTVWQSKEESYQAVYLADTGQKAAIGKFTISRLEKADLRLRLRNEGLDRKAEESGSGTKKEKFSLWERIITYGKAHALLLAGGSLMCIALLLLFRLLWLHSVVLYCYNGKEEYRRIALLHLKRQKKEFSLYLSEDILKEAETPRYRLLLKEGLVKRFKNMDLVVESGSYKLRQPMEECVDFVL